MRAARRHVVPVLLLLSLAACGVRPRVAGAQVSPGPLARAHAAIDGPTDCFKCHAGTMSKAGMDGRCLACHTEIGWMRARHRGTHARLQGKECVSCHPDHGGRDFQLVIWDSGSPASFDHRRTGYALAGRHATLECARCHTPALQKSGAAPLIRKRDRAHSWLGLETACASCHADPHRGQLGADCARCHDSRAFKPAPGFDHAKTAYPLTGRHAALECARCHLAPRVAIARDEKGQPLAQWKPLPHQDCVDCHQDPHEGRFKGACARCHTTTAAWTSVSRTGFNHDLTRYPLRGRHAQVPCADCHDPRRAFGEKPHFALCTDCHQDAHAGKATLLGKAADCAACHGVDGFDRSTYTAAAHAQARYPLRGRHATTECGRCHVRLDDRPAVIAAWGTARVVMRPPFERCTACHVDPHAGRFEPEGTRPHRDGCLSCHSLDAFRPSRYDRRMHRECVFPLAGAHEAVPCQNCHEELQRAPGPSSLPADSARVRPLRFDNPRRKCADCHEGPHGRQFAWRKDGGACDGCHDDLRFVPATRFDHSRDARYRLEGAHLRTPCAGCHAPQRDSSGRGFTVYRPTPMNCEACHAAGIRDTTLAPAGGPR